MLTFLTPTFMPPAYPNDGTDDLYSTLVVLTDQAGVELARKEQPLDPQKTPVDAWGAEIQVEWAQLDLASSRTYRYPSAVTLVSLGPAPVPEGTSLSIVIDDQYLEDIPLIRVGTPTTDLAFIVKENPIETSTLPSDVWPDSNYGWDSGERIATILRSLPQGESVQFTFEAVGKNTAEARSIVNASILLGSPPSASGWRRNLPAEVTDLTPSGQPNLTTSTTGTT
ncbi:hypothetical protein [Rathayibacter tanaceti]|uniref:Uncharacterized protein n=1 Tax=Rathayibacter tanaceti TaxID=1671680 RepID=A0AAE6V6M6_9MICO|nr:hypothetical protein [Rathayibacter tanaceti]QHC54516.1 hypothetical protein GSU10_01800 [Rathayibacter tanaceti]